MFRVGTTNESVRKEWIKNTLARIPAGSKILDAGAGECQFKPFCGHLEYIAQDFAQYDGGGDVGLQTGEWDNSKLDIVSDITAIPLPDQSVDAIMCTEVFEHIPDPISAIREFRRLLKPGGYLLITAPFCSLTHFAPYHFYSGFNRFFYEHHLPANDFEITDLEMNGNYFEYTAQEVRRVKWAAREYAGTKISLLDKVILHAGLWVLQRLSKKDKGSSELLGYGVHVFARKK
ncbi:bifunctional 2-polyprenyl-6-hydroxyphenol methylase/3-demethylubiquinol 3-O-methyltransferase UbiG [Chitinophaga sp. XS-30]|uniref:class I SAM-dependent methyltransferase n=1 Tax=Chitinophaga sp. XS-30 TaxID=2604421 RepID=UPI001AEFE13E|nr:class I SAM-dependent methyltransferase [Chitinophaga sp. XS-30]